jgi:hypothetical protein
MGNIMKLKFLLFALSIISIYPFSLQAKEVAGINISESISLSGQSKKLSLNGAGIRAKFIFDIYVGSLYLEKKATTVNEIYTLPGQKRVGMHFLYDEVSKEKLVNGWNDGFENNHTSEELLKLKTRISQFNDLFITVKEGDIINLDFIPNKGTSVIINNKTMGLIKGDDFFIAVLKIWLGDEPADSDLKEAMLGNNN